MVDPNHSAIFKTYSKIQEPQQQHGLVRQEGLITVGAILLQIPLYLAFGNFPPHVELFLSILFSLAPHLKKKRKKKTKSFLQWSNRYLDQLGMSSSYDTKTYCRQTLVGGNYGLLNTATYVPNPDYYRQCFIFCGSSRILC